MDEYAMYEARYLNMDSEGRMALEQCVVDIYKAVLTYAAEMKYYIHHRLGIYFRSFEEKEASQQIEFGRRCEHPPNLHLPD